MRYESSIAKTVRRICTDSANQDWPLPQPLDPDLIRAKPAGSALRTYALPCFDARQTVRLDFLTMAGWAAERCLLYIEEFTLGREPVLFGLSIGAAI